MKRINPINAALSVAVVLGLYHLCWAALVAAGCAKPIMDFVLRLHFIQIQYEMARFDAVTAVGLVAVSSALGAAVGLVFALVWNWLAARPD
jgi:hypothetical protein